MNNQFQIPLDLWAFRKCPQDLKAAERTVLNRLFAYASAAEQA